MQSITCSFKAGRTRMALHGLAVFTLVTSTVIPAIAEDLTSDARATKKLHREIVQRGVRYLQNQGQASDGSFSAGSGPGVTALVTTAILRNGYSPEDPLVSRSLDYLRTFIQQDGGIYAPGSIYRNYETSLAVMCFAEAEKKQPRAFKKIVGDADRFLKGLQYG